MTLSTRAFADDSRAVPGKTVRVSFASSSTPAYDIVIGHGALADVGNLIRARMGARRCVIVTDAYIEPLYRVRLDAALTAAGHQVLSCFCLPAGENCKDFPHLQKLLDAMLAAGVDRKTVVVALGGSMVGDLAGLAASLVMRGVDLVQIPTTLLAQVDGSIGGKTGIDTLYGKNTIGAFYQPRLIVADVALLDSLPLREMLAGYAEILKYGLISDPPFFRWCLTHGGRLLNGDPESQVQAVSTSCAAKARIIAIDEREAGMRALLSFGHTFGYALETAMGYGPMLNHGEAVAIGMAMAMRLSVRLGLCPAADEKAVRDHMAEVGLPLKPPSCACDIDKLMSSMAQDKKAEAGKMTLILSRGIGQAFTARDVAAADIRAVWESFLS